MRRLGQILRWTVAVGAAATILAIVLVPLATRTAWFREFLRAHAQNYFADNYQGHLTIDRVQGSIFGNLQLLGVALHYRGSEVAYARRIDIRYRLLPLIYATFSVKRLEIAGLRLRAKEDAKHQWNLLEAVSERAPAPSASVPAIQVLLDNVLLRGADLSAALADGTTYRLSRAELDGRVRLLARGTVADVSRLEAKLSAPRIPPCAINASLAYQDVAAPASLRVRYIRLATAALSKIELSGAITDLDKLALDATLKVDRLSGADIERFVPRWRKSVPLSGGVQLAGDKSAYHATLAITSGRAKISGKLSANLARLPCEYSAAVNLANIDIASLMMVKGFAVVLSGSARMAGSGTAPGALRANADLKLANLVVNRWRFGNLALSTAVDAGLAKFNAIISGARGAGATSSGELHFIGTPAYRFAVAVKNLRLESVEPSGVREHGIINLAAGIDGKGVTLATMEAGATVDWRRSFLGPVRIDGGILKARITKGSVEFARASLRAGATEASATGMLSLTGARRGRFTYRFRSSDIAPWLGLAGRSGSGSLNVDGSVEGRLGDLSARGELSASRFHYGSVRIAKAEAKYTLSGIGGGIPYGRVNADIESLKAGVELRTVRLAAESGPGRRVAARISLDAVDTDGRPQKVLADVRYESGSLDGRLEELTLEMPDGRWQLAHAAAFHHDASRTTVSGFALVNGSKCVTLEAEIARSGAQNVMLAVQNFNLANVDDFLGNRYRLGGSLSAQARITGTAAAPAITSQMEIDSPTVRGVTLAGLAANLSYESGTATFRIIARQDSRHELTADGTLAWGGGFEALPRGTINAHIQSRAIALTFLKNAGLRSVTDIQGTLSIDVTLSGPLRHPVPSGEIQLRDAKAVVRPLGVAVASASAYVRLEPGRISLKALSARSGDGVFRLSGASDLEGYVPRGFKLSARFENWPAIDTRRYKATIGGAVTLSGSPAAPTLQGKLEVLSATLRPELQFLEASSSVKPDPTIVVLRHGAAKPAEQASAEEVAAMNGYRNLAIAMDVRVRRDTWIRHGNSYADLRGDVQVLKRPDGPLTLVGSIETVRGSIEIAQQALTLSQGQILFTGGTSINPSLNLVARRDVPNYTVYAVISGTASKPTLTLRSDPSLPQADILSILMFGRPVTQLGQAQQSSLQQQAVSIAGGYAASSVAQSIARSLGLGALNLSVEAGRAAVGRYVTENIYVSASQSIVPGGPQTPGEAAQQASIRYYITPHLDLQTSTSRTASDINLNWRFQY
jgi:autotransporter translocation and assembly factor TamB